MRAEGFRASASSLSSPNLQEGSCSRKFTAPSNQPRIVNIRNIGDVSPQSRTVCYSRIAHKGGISLLSHRPLLKGQSMLRNVAAKRAQMSRANSTVFGLALVIALILV